MIGLDCLQSERVTGFEYSRMICKARLGKARLGKARLGKARKGNTQL